MTSVTGTVTIDGKSPERGSISFIPVDGMTATSGAVITQGKYESQAPLGESKVEIRVPNARQPDAGNLGRGFASQI
jgi:hypothetical protein